MRSIGNYTNPISGPCKLSQRHAAGCEGTEDFNACRKCCAIQVAGHRDVLQGVQVYRVMNLAVSCSTSGHSKNRQICEPLQLCLSPTCALLNDMV